MHIAILGATSQIAKDFIIGTSDLGGIELSLFARKPNVVHEWLATANVPCPIYIADLYSFTSHAKPFDAIINFIGSGNPAQTVNIGASIFDVTYEFDSLAISYLRNHPNCRYIFFSSGAAYGGDFALPVDEHSVAVFPLNQFESTNWYGMAKLNAECRHRAYQDFSIVDIRVFNYFSYCVNIESRFLITDVLRAIKNREIFQTSNTNIMRDYVGPKEVCSLIQCILASAPLNIAVDCYSKKPLDKISLLESMRLTFGLRYEFTSTETGIMATGNKINYYSCNYKANKFFGYEPQSTSLEIVTREAQLMIDGNN